MRFEIMPISAKDVIPQNKTPLDKFGIDKKILFAQQYHYIVALFNGLKNRTKN